MFDKLFNRKKSETLYVAEMGFILDGSEECYAIIERCITSKNVIQNGYSGLELIFEDKKLIKASECTENYDGKIVREQKTLQPNEIGMLMPDFKPLDYLFLQKNNNGLHQLGGNFSEEFQQPDHNCVTPFQYLGYINSEDKNFTWLPFRFHLTCPIYMDFEELFLDYSNPQKPVIINKDDFEKIGTAYDEEFNKSSYIIFEPTKFDFVERNDNSDMATMAGMPRFVQYPNIPKCPKTGKRMQFLFQSGGGTKVKETNIVARDDWYKRYFEEMNFWGGGNLYVFFEPSSKVACYFIQNT